MSAAPVVRRATPADVPTLAHTLARAFIDDPVAEWAFGRNTVRPKALERFHATRLRQTLVDEEVWTTDALDCAAVWTPPKRWRKTPREEIALGLCFLGPRLLARMPLVALGWHGLERKHPANPPHWYLAVLGVEPESQGQGLGSAVLRPVLEQCDIDGIGAYVESSKERNIDFYARHGFRVTAEPRLLRGPTVWTMWREPRS